MELLEEDEQQDGGCIETQHGDGQVRHAHEPEDLHRVLPVSGQPVQLPRGVVHGVEAPQQGDGVAQSVGPVPAQFGEEHDE